MNDSSTNSLHESAKARQFDKLTVQRNEKRHCGLDPQSPCFEKIPVIEDIAFNAFDMLETLNAVGILAWQKWQFPPIKPHSVRNATKLKGGCLPTASDGGREHLFLPSGIPTENNAFAPAV